MKKHFTNQRAAAIFCKTLTVLLAVLFTPRLGQASANGLVISQVYGGGGSASSTYANDFIELFNNSPTAFTIPAGGYSVQYASATTVAWAVTVIPQGTIIAPYGYYLIQQGSPAVPAGALVPLTPDATGTANMAANAGKVALVNASTALVGQVNNPTQNPRVIDFVGYGSTADTYEGGAAAPAPSGINSIVRQGSGSVDTDENGTDFLAQPATPRNAASPSVVVTTTPGVSQLLSTSATAGGSVLLGGNPATAAPAIVERGMVVGTAARPRIGGSGVSQQADVAIVGDGSGTFSLSITGLIPGTTYRVAAYAITAGGTASYGMDVTFTTPALSTFYAKSTGALNVLSTYGTNLNGTGTAPLSFTAAKQVFTIRGGNRTINTAWTVSGTDSKVVLSSGAVFTIPANANNFTGPLDLSSGATLVQRNAAPAVAFGIVDAASTIEYAQADAYTVPLTAGAVRYGNLTLRNGTKLLTDGTTFVRGNLLVDNVGTTGSNFFGGPAATTPIVSLTGNLTLTGTVAFGATARIEVVATNTAAPQVFDGGSNTIRLYKLTLGVGQAGVSLATGTSNLELGNTAGGGYDLATGTVLAVNSNTLSFAAGGKASITTSTTSTGLLSLSPGSSLYLSKNNAASFGTLRLTPTSTRLTNLTVDLAGGGSENTTLALPLNLTIDGALTLLKGILDISERTLTLNGTVAASAVTGQFAGNANSVVAVGPGVGGPVGTLAFTASAGVLKSLSLNRPGATLTVGGGAPLQVAALTLSSGTLAIGAAASLAVAGPLVVADPAVAKFAGTSTSNLSFTGTGDIGPLAFVTGQDQLSSLRMNTATSAPFPTVQLLTSLTVNTLILTRGALFVQGAAQLTLLSTGSLTGGNATSYVNKLTRASVTNATTASASLVFPLGVNGQYRSFNLSVTDDVTTGGATTYYTARQIEDAAPNRTLPGSLARVSQIRYFNVVKQSAGPSVVLSATVRLTYDLANDRVTTGRQGLLRLAMTDPLDNTKWTNVGGSGSGGNITSAPLIGAALTLGDFALATDITSGAFNPLPVELVRFEATRQAAGVRLTWATASEQNSARFEVQRSLDGLTFGTVASVAAQGTTAQPTAYAALDKAAPTSLLYYRLRQVDVDGTEAYSPVKTVAGLDTPAELTLYPNPTTDHLTAALPATAGRTYRVLNALGQVVGQGPAETDNPTVEVRQLPAGLYFLELRTTAGSQVRRFMKNN